MPSVCKPLLFLGGCVFHCTTRGCQSCEKNFECQPLLFDFLTHTYLSILRAYTCGRKGRKGKQGERDDEFSEMDIRNHMAQSFNFSGGKTRAQRRFHLLKVIEAALYHGL